MTGPTLRRAFGSLALLALLVFTPLVSAYKPKGPHYGKRPVVPEPRIKHAPYYNEAKYMFEFVLLSYVTQNTRAYTPTKNTTEAQILLTDFAADTIRKNLTQMNSVYGSDLELVWGPAYLMEKEYKKVPGPTVSSEYKDQFPSSVNSWLHILWPGAISQQCASPNATHQTYMNMMYVVYDRNIDTYIVGIAGTNGISSCTWILEDFSVALTKDWRYGAIASASETYEGAGVFIGLDYGLRALQWIKPLGTAAGFNQTMEEFWASRDLSPKTTIKVTGHSLGGVSLDERDTADTNVVQRKFVLSWNAGPYRRSLVASHLIKTSSAVSQDTLPAEIHVASFASATSGNALWSAYYDSRPLAKNTFYYNNHLDVITKAWVPSRIDSIPGLYIPEVLPANNPELDDCMQNITEFLYRLLDDRTTARPAADHEITFAVGYSPAFPGLVAPSDEPIIGLDETVPPARIGDFFGGGETSRSGPWDQLGPFVGSKCAANWAEKIFGEAIVFQHIVPYALIFAPLVTAPSIPTPPPLPQQGCRFCSNILWPRDVPCICFDPMLPVPKQPPPPTPQIPEIPPAQLPPGVTPVPKAIQAMITKVALVAENCPFEQLQVAIATVQAHVALCLVLEQFFWNPVTPSPTVEEVDKCLGCIAERGEAAARSCDYFFQCIVDWRKAQDLVVYEGKTAIKEFCCPYPLPPFIPPPSPEELKKKKYMQKYGHKGGYGKPMPPPPPPMPVYY